MSLRAMLWALHDAPVSEPVAVLVLLGLADHAADDGTGAWPSRRTLASYGRTSVDTVDRRLQLLLDGGLIRRGDQQLVAHLRADRRPVVYDLALTTGPQPAAPSGHGAAESAPRGRNTPGHGAAAVRHRTVLNQEQTSAGARPPGARAATPPACPSCQEHHQPSKGCRTTRTHRPAPPDLRGLVQAAREDAPHD